MSEHKENMDDKQVDLPPAPWRHDDDAIYSADNRRLCSCASGGRNVGLFFAISPAAIEVCKEIIEHDKMKQAKVSFNANSWTSIVLHARKVVDAAFQPEPEPKSLEKELAESLKYIRERLIYGKYSIVDGVLDKAVKSSIVSPAGV